MTARVAGALLVAAIATIYAASLLFNHPARTAAADSYYHFAVAREIWSGHLTPDVAAGLPWTVLHDMPVDHYWGYHMAIAPFAAFASPEVGLKVAACALFTMVFLSSFFFLHARRVPFAWAWALLPSMFSTQDWRYLQLRGGQLVLPLLYLLLHLAFFFDGPARVRRIGLVLLGYAGMLSYHGAVLLFPMHVVGALALTIRMRREETRGAARARLVDPFVTLAGLALGLLINPYMDRRASTFRFAAYHIFNMGSDAHDLYAGLDIAEFHGFPARILVLSPEWGVLLAASLVAVAWTFVRLARRRVIAPDVVVTAAVTFAAILLTAKAMRVREYSVPLAFTLFGLLSRSRAPLRPFARTAVSSLVIGLLLFGLVHHWDATWVAIDRHLPLDQFALARPLLAANGTRPILNLAEADYCTLKWQKPDVVCVHGLSRYFLYPDRALYDDVWTLHDRPDQADTTAILRRFHDRGVRLVTTHGTHPLALWAEKHPDVLAPVFVSVTGPWVIWRIDF